MKEEYVLFGTGLCVWGIFLWLWLVVPEGRDVTPGPNSGEVPATAHGAVENALFMTSVFLVVVAIEWRRSR